MMWGQTRRCNQRMRGGGVRQPQAPDQWLVRWRRATSRGHVRQPRVVSGLLLVRKALPKPPPLPMVPPLPVALPLPLLTSLSKTVAVAVAAAPRWRAARCGTRPTALSYPPSRPRPRFPIPSPCCSDARTRRQWRVRPSPHLWGRLPRFWPANRLAYTCTDSPADPTYTVRCCPAPCGIPRSKVRTVRVSFGGTTAD